jgi:hypothetical protein
MGKAAAVLLALAGIVLLGRLGRDGHLARTDAVARILGYGVRVEVTIERPHHLADAAAPSCRLPEDRVQPDTVMVRRVLP